jgi:hypothetical protein
MVQNNTITVIFPYANGTEYNYVVPGQYIPFNADRERYLIAANSCEKFKAFNRNGVNRNGLKVVLCV